MPRHHAPCPSTRCPIAFRPCPRQACCRCQCRRAAFLESRADVQWRRSPVGASASCLPTVAWSTASPFFIPMRFSAALIIAEFITARLFAFVALRSLSFVLLPLFTILAFLFPWPACLPSFALSGRPFAAFWDRDGRFQCSCSACGA